MIIAVARLDLQPVLPVVVVVQASIPGLSQSFGDIGKVGSPTPSPNEFPQSAAGPVHIVAIDDQADPFFAPEEIQLRVGLIGRFGARSGIHLAENAKALALFGDDIYRLVRLSVLESCKACLITQSVVHFDALDHFGRNKVQSRL